MRLGFQEWLPRIVVAPIFLLSLSFIYGLMIWNGYLSLSASKMLPNYELIGLRNYFDLFASDRFPVAMTNIVVFALLYVSGTIALGVCLAIMLDQKIRAEGVLRSIYLFPMAISFIVTGTAWRWIFNPGVGIESVVRGWGFESFTFDWITRSETALYCIVIAGIWQGAGFVMALFLAGLRGVDDSILKAAVIDGATRFKTYTRIVLPMLRPVFLQRRHNRHAPGDQGLRPGRRAGRQRSWLLHRPARHVLLHDRLRPQSDRRGRVERRGHAMHGRVDRRPLHVFRTQGATEMTAAVDFNRLLLWALLILCALWFLLPLFVMVSTSLKNLDEIR